jgi:hypothetical protein
MDVNLIKPGRIVNPDEEPLSIAKPNGQGGGLDQFRVTRAPTIANVEVLQTALPVRRIADARDFVRVHPDEDNYWTDDLCFVEVPVIGDKKRSILHLISETLALEQVSSALIKRYRLALATKPHDVFFWCIVPTTNLDNSWVATAIQGIQQAKTRWTQVVSRKAEGIDAYMPQFARHEDAFPIPRWPTEPINTLVLRTFAAHTIDRPDHPGLLRLVGARQDVS